MNARRKFVKRWIRMSLIAASVGDDRMMQMAGRRVPREAFTHGSSEERAQWFRTGLSKGDLNACDTFGQAGLR